MHTHIKINICIICNSYFWDNKISKYCYIHRIKKKKVPKSYSFRKSNYIKLKKWRNEVIAIKGNYCKCGNKAVSVHHIIPISMDKSKAFDINNGEPMCNSCHRLMHLELPNKFFNL